MSGTELEVAWVVAGSAAAGGIAVALSRRRPPWSPRRPQLAVAVMSAIFFLAYMTLALLKFDAYNMGAEDLGRIDQAIWSGTRGQLLRFSAAEFGHAMSRLAGHVELLYVPLALLFWIWDSAGVLLIAHAMVVALGAWPSYRLGRRIGGTALGVAAAVAYLGHPVLGFATLADLHGDTLALPFLLFALDAGLAGRRRRSVCAMLLAVAAKEYIALLAITCGIYWWLARRDRRLGLAFIALGTLWLALVVPAFHLIYRPADFPELAGVYFGNLGATKAEVIKTCLLRPIFVITEVVTPRKIGVVLVLLAPLALAGLARPALLALTLPVLVPLLASEQLDLRNHHTASLLPFGLWAGLEGARRLFRDHAAVAIVAATAVSHASLAPSPFTVRSWTPGRWDYLGNPHIAGRTPHDAILDQAVAMVPRHARVSVSGHIVPHLSHRDVCFAFPAPPTREDIDWVIVDLTGSYPPHWRTRRSELEQLRLYLDDPKFELVMARDGVVALAKRSSINDGPGSAEAGSPGYPVASMAVGPLRLESDGVTLAWSPTRDLGNPIIVLDAETREMWMAASAPSVPLPWTTGVRIPESAPFPHDARLLVLELHEGFPVRDGAYPPQPWLPDSYAGERQFGAKTSPDSVP